MRIDVIGRNIEVTDAIRLHAEAKASKLTKFFDGVSSVLVRIAREDHHQHGNFGVEIVLSVVKHDDLVSHAAGDDLYLAIDAAVAKSTRQLTDYKEKLRAVRPQRPPA